MQRPHLFVGGHDPLDGVGSGGQEVPRGGESLRPLTHHHLRLPVCCFWRPEDETRWGGESERADFKNCDKTADIFI